MRPPPSYPPPPTPTPNIPAGYMVTVSGPPDQVTRQQRLLPLSASILCLPALTWTTPRSDCMSPPISRRSSRNQRLSRASIDTQRATSRQSRHGQDVRGSRQSTADQLQPPTLAEIKGSVLKLHQDYLQRYEQARRFLEKDRGPAEGDRRIVFFNGSERDAKAICIDGLRQGLRGDEEVEKVWNEILDGGVEGLQSDGSKSPDTYKSQRFSIAESTVSSEGVKHSQNTERSSIGSRLVDPSLSFVRSLSTGPSIGTIPTLRHATEIHHPAVIRYSRGRGDTVVQEHFISLPSPLPEEMESRPESGSPAKSNEYDSGNDEPPMRTKRMDSTYSSGVDTVPSPQRRAEMPDPEAPILGSFKFDTENEGGSSPSRSPRTDAGSTVPSSLHVSTGGSDGFSDPMVEALFPNMREDVAIHLIPENPKERDQFVERLLATDSSRRPISYLASASPLPSPSSPRASFRTSSMPPSLHISPPPFVIVPSKVFLFADKSPLEVQNETRALLMKFIPPTNSAADTPTSLEFPEASKWLVDSEADLFTPIMTAGFEGLPDALCPGLDMIVAIGADGREQKDSTLTDETERQATTVSRVLSSDIEQLGGRSNADARGCRTTLKHLLRMVLPYLQCHPRVTVEDVAAGQLLVPCIEFCQKHNPNVRLLVIDFDLKTGSQAILGLRSVLPPEMFKLIVVGETVGINSTPHGHGNRIYVRTSVGKTTMSFSAVPSTPLQKDRPKIRRLETAKMSVMARADVVASPWTDKESGDYKLAVALITDGVRERRVLCGVIDMAPPRLVSSRDKEHHPPAGALPPTSPLPLTPPVADRKPPTPPSPPRITRTPSPGTEEPIPIIARPRRASEPRKNSLPSSNPKDLRLKFADTTNIAPPPRFRYGDQELLPPPHPGMMMAVGRRDSDTNSHGGGVSIASPTSLRPPNSPLKGSTSSPSDVKWQEGSYFDARMEDEVDSDEYLSEDEIPQAKQRRKGSKALRWLGIEP